ncbi:MAG TPA: hypothetical protein VMU84_10300, partial [Thermoanaerobaculia bacterium]|nr:hypothetical protein [Thermoanaerobaculia bacterium]
MFDVAPNLSAENCAVVTAMLVLALRLAIVRIPSKLPPALAFAAAPLGLVLMTGFFARDQRYFGWHALAIALITPPILRLVLRNERRVLAALALVIYPISVYAYTNATTLETAEGKPRVNFFENAHMLLPASEMLDGEKLYRDILPAHGMLEDGFFDFIALRVRGPQISNALRARVLIGCLNAVAVYALGAAMTGSMEAGVATFFLASITGTIAPSTIRFLPALFTLAMTASAVRRRNAKWLGYAARGIVICGITSLDFAFYAAAAVIVAALRFRPIKPALKQVMIGLLATGIPLFLFLAILGIADDFVKGTLFEVLPLSEVYAMDIFDTPAGFRAYQHVPEVLAALVHRTSWGYMVWIGALFFTAAALTRKASRRIEPLLVVAVFMVLGAISYAERHHLHFQFATAAFLAGLIWLLFRKRSQYATPAVILALILGVPTSHLAIDGWLRRSRGPIDNGWVEIKDLPRARGTIFTTGDAEMVATVKRYVDTNLKPDETFFDFTNRGLFYVLLHRDCPIRQYEVAFYETEEKQREVIARLERDPRVVMALVPLGPNDDGANVDGVPNAERAPLVWKYLEANFTPALTEGAVSIWKRK